MTTITKPMALDESFNTTESTSRNQADVLAGIESAIRQGFGQVASAVEYDHTDSGLTADNVQDAIDEVDDAVDGLVDDVAEISSDIEITQTASGNPLTLTDCAPINAESLVVELEPKHDLHGQSAPYVGGASKQKLPLTVSGLKASNTGGTWNGNVFTHNNGVTFTVLTDADGNVTGIKVNGTASAQTLFIIAMSFSLAYESIINGCPANGSNSTYMLVAQPNADTGSGYTLPANDARNIYINIASGYTANNLIFYPMVRPSAETDPTFAPYSNICPITGYTECEVDDVGKNKLNLSDYTGNSYAAYGFATTISGEDVIVTLTNYPMTGATESFEILMNTDAIFDKTGLSVKAFISSGDNYVSGVRWSNIQSNNNIAIDLKNLSQGLNATITMRIMVYDTSSGEPTTYEPYHSSNVTIQFGQTVYGGRSNFTDGGTSDEIGVVDLGSLNWSYDATQSHPFFYTTDLSSIIKHIIGLPQPLVACEQYRILDIPTNVTDSVWSDASVHGSMIYHASSPNYVYVRDDRFTDPTVFKTANSGNHLAYMKATPTTIQTPPTDLKLLKGTNNITTNGTTINLGYQPDNVIGDAKEKADKINNSEIVKYTISGNTADLIPLVIDGTGHNDIPIVTDITKYRMLCVELVLKPRTEITGVYFSAIAFMDGIYLPSGIYVPVYMPSGNFHADVTINPDGNGGFKLSYIAINHSQSTPPDYYAIRVRAFNQY